MQQPLFTIFSLSHVATLFSIVCLLSIGLYSLHKWERHSVFHRYHTFLGILVVANLLVWRLIFVLAGDFNVEWDLPLHVCGMSQILLAIYLWTEQQVLYDILFYWVITGSTLGVLIPDLEVGVPGVRFFALFVSHSLSLFIVLYLFFIRKKYPRSQSYHIAIWSLAFYAFGIILPLDYLLQANYLYMLDPPEVNFPLLRLLPPWPWYWPVLFAFFYFLFREIYIGFHRLLTYILKGEQKRYQTGAG